MSRLFYLAEILKHMNVQNVGKGKKGSFIIRRFLFSSFRKEWRRCYFKSSPQVLEICTEIILGEMTYNPVWGQGGIAEVRVARSLVTSMWDLLSNSLYFCVCLVLYIINYFSLSGGD